MPESIAIVINIWIDEWFSPIWLIQQLPSNICKLSLNSSNLFFFWLCSPTPLQSTFLWSRKMLICWLNNWYISIQKLFAVQWWRKAYWIFVLHLRIMHVIPWGQKNPSQHAWQLVVLAGMSSEFLRSTCWLVRTLHAHPGSQPGTHEFKLQFLLGFK